jgi:hypothetical protein
MGRGGSEREEQRDACASRLSVLRPPVERFADLVMTCYCYLECGLIVSSHPCDFEIGKIRTTQSRITRNS